MLTVLLNMKCIEVCKFCKVTLVCLESSVRIPRSDVVWNTNSTHYYPDLSVTFYQGHLSI